jgi:predicted phage baseplate assembly protein
MPLSDAFPKLDDRTYEDLVAEIRARVSRYTPEWKPGWNDLNDSDPGVTLAQVFAWLSEMMLYRMNRVPELNYLKFLELIGVELYPARAARAEVTFAVAADSGKDFVDVPARTQVSATGQDGKPVVFETTRPLRALACELKSVQTYDGAQYGDATPANTEPGSGYLPFGELPRDGGALLLGFARPGAKPFPAATVELACWSIERAATPAEGDAPAPRVRTCGPISTNTYAPAGLQWEGWDGVRWTPLDALNDETFAFTRTGYLRVRVPATAKLARGFVGTYDGTKGDPLYWLRARLVRTQYERAPRLLAVRINTVPAEQAQTVKNEILGGATGQTNQIWQLANSPVIAGSLKVEIDEGSHEHVWETDEGKRERAWKVVDDLFGAGPNDRLLVLNRTSGEVLAGDGENGAIPVANPSAPDSNVVAVEYRYGGGASGNVAAKEIKNLLTPIDGIDSGKVENPFAASGGLSEERLSEAQRRARLALRARERAVTPEDFELLAGQAGNVKRAKALPLAHPQFQGIQVPGAITVIVVPDDRPDPVPGAAKVEAKLDDFVGSAPTPSDGLLRTVCEYLDARRLLTTEVFVVAPRYVPLKVQATAVVKDDADPGAVKQAVEIALARYFHAIEGGDDELGWPFGGSLRYSKIVQRAFVDGVDSVPLLKLTLDGEEKPECRDVPLEANALLTVVEVQVDALTALEFEERNP